METDSTIHEKLLTYCSKHKLTLIKEYQTECATNFVQRATNIWHRAVVATQDNRTFRLYYNKSWRFNTTARQRANSTIRKRLVHIAKFAHVSYDKAIELYQSRWNETVQETFDRLVTKFSI